MRNIQNKQKYMIFSKVVEINYNNNIESTILMNELSLYEKAKNNSEADIIINIEDVKSKKGMIASNPRACRLFEDGFEFEYTLCTVNWKIDNKKIIVNFCLKNRSKTLFKNFFFKNYFYHSFELIGMLIHECVLLPAILMFFSEELVVLHGSAFADGDGNAYLVTGVGGSGKTSSSMHFLLKDGLYFLSDDMCLVNKNGKIFSNFAYPKIHFYNTINQKDIEKKILQEASLLTKLHWEFSASFNRQVFRRISPKLFYDNRILLEGRVKKIFVLFRCNVLECIIDTFDKNSFVDFYTGIIVAEWNSLLFEFLIWNKFNHKALRKENVVDMDVIISNLKSIYAQLFDISDIYLVKIPFDLKPEQLYSFLRKKL